MSRTGDPRLRREVRGSALLSLASELPLHEAFLEHSGHFFRLHSQFRPDLFRSKAFLVTLYERHHLVKYLGDVVGRSTRKTPSRRWRSCRSRCWLRSRSRANPSWLSAAICDELFERCAANRVENCVGERIGEVRQFGTKGVRHRHAIAAKTSLGITIDRPQ